MSAPLFSILIANYNNGKFFHDCWESILKQTYTNWEVIIVDDCSTDDSVQLISNCVNSDARVKIYYNEKNRGCGYTKRRCAELASTPVAGFLDPDDALLGPVLEVMVNAHRNNPEASIISSKYYFTDLQLNIIKECGHGSEIPTQHSYLTMGKGAITHFTSFKTAKYSQTVGINEKFKRAVDQDLYLKLEEVGKHVFINEFFYLYRINENSISANENVFKAAYWHFRAKKDAYYRRKQQKVQVKNFSDEDFIKLANSYYLSRLKRAAKLKRYKSKYYFLFQSILVSCTLDWKYKLRCLIIPNYY